MIYPEAAQTAINEIIAAIRTKNDFSLGFNRALEILQKEYSLDRALILQVSGDQLTITHEVAKNVESSSRKSFTAQESTMMILTMLSRSPDGATIQALSLERDEPDESFLPYLQAFKDVSSHLLAEIRGQIFPGFLIMQSTKPRKWTSDECSSLEKISEILAVIITLWFDQQKLISDYRVLEAQSKISSLYVGSQDSFATRALKGVELIAHACCFENFKLYLLDAQHLVDPVTDEHLALDDLNNPFVSVSKVKRGCMFISESETIPECFAGKGGMIVPLLHQDNLLGVFGMWNSSRHDNYVSPQNREIALTLACKLSEQIAANAG